MLCICVLQRVHTGDGVCEASILCKYDRRDDDLFALS